MLLFTTLIPTMGSLNNIQECILNDTEHSYYLSDYTPGIELITTHWGQKGEYNRLCPIDPNTNEPFRLGCWSVAIGQISRYHEIQSRGFVEYLYQNQDGDYIYLSNDLDTLTYDWNFMVDELDEFSTENEKLHVSTLLYDTATVIQKNFGWGGYGTIIGTNYSKVRLELMEHYQDIDSLTTWDDDLTQGEIIDEIDHYRPIMFYMDAAGVPAHAVVLDGYQFKDYPNQRTKFQVHLNYGWYGSTDGWYNYSNSFPGPYGPDDYDNPSFRKGLLIRISPRVSDFIGPKMEMVDIECMFSISTNYDSNPPLYYMIDWDDRTSLEWLGPYQLEETCTASHSWNLPGIYDIKLKAKNDMGCQSEWIEHSTIFITKYSHLLPILAILVYLMEIFPSLETYLMPFIELICN